MKKTLTKFILTVFTAIFTFTLAGTVFAVEKDEKTLGDSKGSSATSTTSSVSENDLFYRFQYSGVKESPGNIQTKIGAVNALPDKTWQQTLAGIIRILLNISGGLLLVSTTISGVIMITSTGNPDMTDKGKKLLIASIAGIVIISVAYALVIGVSQLQIFQPGTAGSNTSSSSSLTSTPAANQGPQGAGGVAIPKSP